MGESYDRGSSYDTAGHFVLATDRYYKGMLRLRYFEEHNRCEVPSIREAKPMPTVSSIDDPRYVKALSHPLRVRILGILEDRPASPVELTDLLDATLGTVSYHVRQLNDLGLLKLVRETPRRGAIEHHYRAQPRPTSGGSSWEAASLVTKQAVIGAELQHTVDAAQRAAAVGGFDREPARLERLRLRLDDKGRAALGRAVDKLVEETARIEAASAKRLKGDEPATDTALAALLFELPAAADDATPRASRGRRTDRR
jgi:DNA-binding transcriptional ArsR family regulator